MVKWSVTQGHRENWVKSMCTSFGEECRLYLFFVFSFSKTINNGQDYTGVIITVTPRVVTSSWTKSDQSKVAYHLTNYIQANSNEVEIGGNVYPVINEPYYVPNPGTQGQNGKEISQVTPQSF